ncbi:hypothetical protein FRC19_002089, partial [Serendipita sp. 401]
MMVSSLSSYEQQIASLSQQLCSQIEEYRGLRAPLIEYSKAASSLQARSSLDKAETLSPISRCPNEVLDYIFQLIAEDGSHNLRPLLMMNKRLYRIIVSNPNLWTKIFIKIDEELQEVNSLSAS